MDACVVEPGRVGWYDDVVRLLAGLLLENALGCAVGHGMGVEIVGVVVEGNG